MRHVGLVLALVGGLLLGAQGAVLAKLPPPPAKSDAENAAEAEKAAAAKAAAAALNDKYVDKAVANYKKNKGMADAAASPASTSGKK